MENIVHKFEINKIIFHSTNDLSCGFYMEKVERILLEDIKTTYTDINEILELYNIKKYLDNGIYLKAWSEEDILKYKQKTKEYAKIIGIFMYSINDKNVLPLYRNTLNNYIHSFWELINNHKIFKQISSDTFLKILTIEPNLIYEILTHKCIVDYYKSIIKQFLLTFPYSAEILIQFYEALNNSNIKKFYLPDNFVLQEKEEIILNYLNSGNAKLNYLAIIINVRKLNDFEISNSTRLKAKRIYEHVANVALSQNSIKYGVKIVFDENSLKLKEANFDKDNLITYTYSFDYIKKNCDFETLYRNFKNLFEFVDIQNRIELVSKKNELTLFESILGIKSKNEYITGLVFTTKEQTAMSQIFLYDSILSELNISLEQIINYVFTTLFINKYEFPNNAVFLVPTPSNAHLEKVRILAPEFESVIKQFILYVEEKSIDFGLMQVSYIPLDIKNIPSLNQKKYIYFNEKNKEMCYCRHLLFSNQTMLTFIEPFKDKQYQNFFELLANEQLQINSFEEYQMPELNFLIDMGLISIDNNGLLFFTNIERLMIIQDLYENEVASYYHYLIDFQKEAEQMAKDNIIFFESTLFSKPEQSYINYILNKKEFTNGLDVRNKYLHGTQAHPLETQKHTYSYYKLLILLFLTMFKIEDDLMISKTNQIR